MTRTSQTYTRDTSPQPQLPSRLVRLLSEAKWLVLTVMTTYLVLILLTYAKSDPGWSHATHFTRMHNWGGMIGARAADLLFYIFGLSAWWFCVLLFKAIYQGYRRLSEGDVEGVEPIYRQEKIIRGAGFVMLLAGSVGLEFVRMYSLKVALPLAPGGVLGALIGGTAQKALGFTGATLLLVLLFGLGFSLFFHVSWLTMAARIGAA